MQSVEEADCVLPSLLVEAENLREIARNGAPVAPNLAATAGSLANAINEVFRR